MTVDYSTGAAMGCAWDLEGGPGAGLHLCEHSLIQVPQAAQGTDNIDNFQVDTDGCQQRLN